MENMQAKEKEGEQQNQPPKRIKTQQSEEKGEDRISLLPDGLIIDEILSRLRFTKHAIRTGTLSKRWQHLWPSVPCLCFDDDYFNGIPADGFKPLPDFYIAVDKTLNQCQSNNIIQFEVFADYDKRLESHVDNWMHFVTSRNVKKLTLKFDHLCYEDAGYVLKDDSFFVNSDFIYLQLFGCLLKPTRPIIWNNLTTLIICYVKVENDLIANILSGSPLLDTLRLNFCGGYAYLDITSESVKRLVVDGYDSSYENVVVEINAPYISSLTIEGDFMLWKISLRDVSSLVKANLDYHMAGYNRDRAFIKHQDEMFNRFLVNLRHVKELKIGIGCYEVLARLEVKGFIFPSNLKGVDVISPSYRSAYTRALADCRDSYTSDSSSSESDTSYSSSSESNASDSSSSESNASDSDAYDSDYISS